jgi:hypothetical protein
MRTRRQEQEGITPTTGAATTAVANVSQITDHLGYMVPESWYRLKGGVPLPLLLELPHQFVLSGDP